jgi:hypothetical protein
LPIACLLKNMFLGRVAVETGTAGIDAEDLRAAQWHTFEPLKIR